MKVVMESANIATFCIYNINFTSFVSMEETQNYENSLCVCVCACEAAKLAVIELNFKLLLTH